jgi:hypothetical protein
MSRTFPDISGRSDVPAGTIIILGNVELFCGDKQADLRRQLRKALALMVAARGRRVRRQEIAAAVWGDEERDVRTLMWSLRRALRDCDSGFDVPPDKGKDGNYLLDVAEPGTLEEAVDAFRFLDLTREAEALWKDGGESAAVGRLIAAAGLWGGEPFAHLWPGGPPEACRRLKADLEHARDFLVRSLAEAALRQGGPYEAARAYRGHAVGDPGDARGESVALGGDAAWLAGFLIALHDRPGSEEADQLLAARRGPGTEAGPAREGRFGDDAVARADVLMLLAAEGIDVHRPLTVALRPPVAGSPPVTVGRDAELAAFRRMLDEVRAGHPAALAVRGASGRGKTRLAVELAASAVTAGVPVVLISAAGPGDLRPWQELAERLWPAACRDVGTGRDRAARLTLGQRRALLDFVAPRTGAPARPDPDQEQQVRFAEITRALAVLARAVAARRGLIVALDDADRLTERGRELLGPFLAGLRDAPVGIALFGRDDAPWTDAVLSARADTVRLPLGPLPEQAIGSWLRQVRGRTPTGEELALIARATAGEPVRIRDQVAAAVAGSPQRHPGEAGAADGVLQAPPAWLAAAAITAADLVIDTALVARMLDLADPDADREEGDARRQGRIDTSAGVRFTHGSHRDDVITRLDADPALRRSLHRRAFAVLTERRRDKNGKDDPDPSLPVRIAGHALGADRDLPAAEAARAFLAAARAERASGEAAEAWARAGIAKGPPDPATRASLHLALGDALDQRGTVTEADREYQLAYDIAAGLPLDRAEALIRLARRWTDPGKIDWYLLRGLQDGIAALAGREDDVAVALRLQLTGHLARKSTLAVPVLGTEADEIRRDGVALARAALGQLQDQAGGLPPAAASEVLNECRWALYDYDPPAKTIRLSERLERESLLARSPYFQSEALMTLAIDQLRLGQVTDAQSTLLAHERTMPANHASQWLQLTMETVLDLWHGRFDAAEARLFTVAAPIVARAHAEQARLADTLQQTWQGQVFWLRREQGQVLSQTDPEVFRQVEGHGFFAIWRVGLALASYDAGDLPGAAGHVRALDEDYQGFDAFPPHGWTVSVAALLAELCLAMSPAGRPGAAGDPPGRLPPGIAGRLRVILSRYAGEFVLAGWPSVLLGPAERFSGLLATAMGDYEEALHLFDAVADKVAGAPPQAARLQVNRARALLLPARSRGGQAGPAAAARLLTEAGATADRLGMRALAREASELLSEC